MSSIKSLEMLFKQDLRTLFQNEQFFNKLEKEISQEIHLINRSMTFLPTTKETEALPDLTQVYELSQFLNPPPQFFDLNLKNHHVLRNKLIEELFTQVSHSVIKTRIYNDKTIVKTADLLFMNLVKWGTLLIQEQNPFILKLLNVIINISADYYKTNGKENLNSFPFGESLTFTDLHIKWVDNLKPGDKVDCLQTVYQKKVWSPAIILSNEGQIVKVSYLYENLENFLYSAYFEICPFEQMKDKYEWRLKVQQGDLVDTFNYKKNWFLSEVVKVVKFINEEGKEIIDFVLKEKNQQEDDLDNDEYTLPAFSPLISKPQSFSDKTAEINDLDDEFYLSTQNKKKYAIMRQINSSTASIYFVKYINIFGENSGFDYIFNVLENQNQVPQEILNYLINLIKSTSENLVRPFIQEHGQQILKYIVDYLLNNSKENLRNIDKNNLKTFLDIIGVLSQRIYSPEKSKEFTQEIELKLSLICLKSDFLEKQFFGAKLLNYLEKKTRMYDSSLSKEKLGKIIKDEGIFSIIIRGHPSLISKGNGVLKVLFSEGAVTRDELNELWEQILKTDIESRNALLSLLKEVLYELSKEEVIFLIEKMLSKADNITNQELFDLLFILKKIGWNRWGDVEIVNKVNSVIWSIIQNENEMKEDFVKEVMRSFIKFIESHNQNEYIEKIIKNIIEGKNSIRNIKLLKKLLKMESQLVANIIQKIKEYKLLNILIDEIVDIINTKMRQINQEKNKGTEINSTQVTFNEKEEEKVKIRCKFIDKVLNATEDKTILPFGEVEKIWKVILRTGLNVQQIFNWLRNYIIKENEEKFDEKYTEFFLKNLEEFKKSGRSQLFSFFVILFYKINLAKGNLARTKIKLEAQGICSYNVKTDYYYVQKTSIQNFEGYDKIWQLYLETEDMQLEETMTTYLIKFFWKSQFNKDENEELFQEEKENMYKKFREMIMSGEKPKVRKAARLLNMMIQKEERFGFGELKSFDALKNLPRIGISFEKDNSYYKEKNTILMHKNKTLADLRKKISQEYNMNFESILLKIEGEEQNAFNHLQNSQTLENLNIQKKKNNSFIVKEYELPEQEEMPLLNEQKNNFHPKVLLVFGEIFESFSTEEKMYKSQLAKFTTKATDGNFCNENDERIESVFEKYAPNQFYLLKDQFIQFYLDCALQSDFKLNTVRNNLHSLGYDKNLRLKKFSNNVECIENVKSTLRFKIAQDKEFYEELYKYMDNSEENVIMVSFLKFLTPNFDLLKELVNNPVEFIKSNNSSSQLWNYFTIILEAIIYHHKQITNLFTYFEYEFKNEEKRKFLKQIFDINFCNLLLRKVENIDPNQEKYFEMILSPLHILEGILKIGIDFGKEDYILDTTNFISFSIKIKKKKKQEQEVEKKKEDIQNKFIEQIWEQPAEKNEQETQATQQPIRPVENPAAQEQKKLGQEEKSLLFLKSLLEGEKTRMEEFLNNLPFKKMIELMMKFLNKIFVENIDNKMTNKKGSIKVILIILLSSLNISKEILNKILSDEKSGFKELLFKGLTNQATIIRIYFKNFYFYLTSNINNMNVKRSFLSIIINSIKILDNNEEMHVLIELASNLLNEISELKQQKNLQDFHSELDLGKILQEFSHKLMNYESKEINFNQIEDNSLIAILTFMEKIIKADNLVLEEMPVEFKNRLILFIFKECLFKMEKEEIQLQKIICKSTKSRGKAMELLIALINNDPKAVILLMIKGFMPLQDFLPNINFNRFQGEFLSKNNQTSYLGIRNPGCVCYMNAMLQQFYCIPTFRYGILMADDQKPEQIIQISENFQIDDNVFHQFQKMFAYLDQSQRPDFNPKEFCGSYKDLTGERVNVLVQQDAQEFLNMIFDKLEESLKNTPFKGILDSVFKGKNTHVLTCNNCGFKRAKEEIYYDLSLEVKNMDNLEDSFKKLMDKEIISDYLCDNCKKKCDITKQNFLTELPNVLVIHLQKIIFDLELLINNKISSRYEFPKTLNLKKHMFDPEILEQKDKENLNQEQEKKISQDDSEFEYKLVGVVVHRGNANFGHYTSLINVNRQDPNRAVQTEDKWLEFDDSKISPFNMDNFEEECFGSKMEKEYHNNFIGMEANISKSAYILVYDKVKKSKLKLKFDEHNLGELEKVVVSLKEKQKYTFSDNILETDFYNLNTYIPPNLQKIIQQDNISLILENLLFSSHFTNGFADLLLNSGIQLLSIDMPVPQNINGYHKTLSDLILKIVPNYFLKIYCISFQNYKIKKIVSLIETALILQPDKIYQFFDTFVYSQFGIFWGLINSSNDFLVHNALGQLLTFTLSLLIKKYDIQLRFIQKPLQECNEQEAAELKFFNCWETLLKIIPQESTEIKNFRKLTAFLQTIRNLCIMNPILTSTLLHQNYLQNLQEIYMKQEFNFNKNLEYTLTHILSIIYVLLCDLKERMYQGQNKNQQRMVDYYNHYTRVDFLEKIMKENYKFNKFEVLKQLVELICIDNFHKSKLLIKSALKGVSVSTDLESIGYLEALKALLNLDDEYFYDRMKLILGIPRLTENRVKKDNIILYTFGLGKESSLKRVMYRYPSSLGNEKSLLDLILNSREMSESFSMIVLYFVLQAALQNEEIFKYLLEMPPNNYISMNLFDWIKQYVEYQMKILPNSYSAPKPQLMYDYFNNFPEILNDFEKCLKQILQKDFGYSEEEAKNFKYFYESEKNEMELDSLHKNYIIGKTLESRLIAKEEIIAEEIGEVNVMLHLIKVSLMPHRSNGFQNLQIPKEYISFESYLNKSSIKEEFAEFIGENYEIIFGEDEGEFQLKPLGEESDPDDEFEEEEQEIKKDLEHKVCIQSNFVDVYYILRISLSNTTNNNYFVEMKIENDDPNHNTGEFCLYVKSGKKDYLVTNLTLWNVDRGFEGLTISVKEKETEENSMKYFDGEFQNDFREVFVFPNKNK